MSPMGIPPSRIMVFGKLSARSVGSANLMLLSYTGIAMVFPIMLAPCAKDYELIWSSQNHLYAILSGLLCGMGFLTFLGWRLAISPPRAPGES